MQSVQLRSLFFLFMMSSALCFMHAQGFEGYYQYPDIHEDRLVFCAEGDLWTVELGGGLAQRLTTHVEEELFPIFSSDGSSILFSASYEGPMELYTIPVDGGMTTRWTYERDASVANAWTDNNELIYATRAYNKKPDNRLVKINVDTKVRTHVPLDQASEASFSDDGRTLYFVRPAYHRNVTKRYKGGTARQIWQFTEGSAEAIKLTKDYEGESHHPMYHDGRVYFISDSDGMMNIWSMAPNGSGLQQHTEHADFDVRYANVSDGVIVYQMGADLWRYDISSDASSKINITLATDLAQLAEKWEENPSRYITSVNASPDGDRIVVTARGRVFVFPTKSGRSIAYTGKTDVRYRDARFSHDGHQVMALSDESGEFEFVSMPSNGVGDHKKMTSDGAVLRYEGIPSPDGKWLAYDDLESNMYVLNIATGVSTKISTNQEGIRDFSWSPDNKWLAYVQSAYNTMAQIRIYNVDDTQSFDLTTDRANSFNPRWSPDGKFIYFISDRSFTSLVGSPWGTRQPEPYFDASEKIYHIALQKSERSPFRIDDELQNDDSQNEKSKKDEKSSDDGVKVVIDKDRIQERITPVPIPAGNYRSLEVNDKAIYMIAAETGVNAKSHLKVVKIGNEKVEAKVMASGIRNYSMTQDKKKLLIRKGSSFHMIDAGTGKIGDLSGDKIDLSGWKFSIDPRQDWKQIFTDAWRMERDYFYDKNMHLSLIHI